MLGRMYGLTCAAALRYTQVCAAQMSVKGGRGRARSRLCDAGNALTRSDASCVGGMTDQLILQHHHKRPHPPQAFHDSRKYPQGVRSPQTTPQVAQARLAAGPATVACLRRGHAWLSHCLLLPQRYYWNCALQAPLPSPPPPTPPTHPTHIPHSVQVKRLLPDPPSMRGVVYPRDSSVILDDVILRPSSAASAKPAAAAPAPTAPVPVPPSRGSAGGAAAAAAALSDGVAVLQLDDVPAMSHVPVNQQRKEAIRAAKASGSPPASPPSAAATALSTALHGAGLQPHTAAAAAAAAIPASRPPADRQRDWLASVFGKAAAQPGVGADAARRVPTSVPQQSPGQHAGYLKAWQQQHSHLHQQQQEQQAGAGKLSAGTPVFLTATAGSAAGAPAPLYGAGADLHAASEPVDLRPSLLHVGVPVGGSGTAPERSASSVQRMRNYFSGATPK